MTAKILKLEPPPDDGRDMRMRLFPDEGLNFAELRRLHRLAAERKFTMEAVHFAYNRVRGWATTNRRKRADWPMVIINAMESAGTWALGRGFKESLARRNQTTTKITAARVEKMLERTAEARRRRID